VARTPLLTALQGAAATVAESRRRRVPVDEVLAEGKEQRSTRRELLERAGVAGVAAAGAAAFGRFAALAQGAGDPRIVIVGGGLAGLTCAYRLQRAGLFADVYEASDRIGGRCWTIRDVFADGQVAEHGGELIDQGHTQLRQLAQELGLKLDNLLRAEPNESEDFYYFDGAPYTYAEAVDDLNGIYDKLQMDISAASYPTLWSSYTQRGYELDHMSIVDWLNETMAPGGAGTKLGQLLDVASNIEYGAESSRQSSLNLLYLLGYSGQGRLHIFGRSNEKYHVVGGNDQVPTLMAAQLDTQIHTGYELVAISLEESTYTLTFEQRGGGTTTVTADRVVLALPFSILRDSVDYSQAGFEPLKQTAIQELGMGTNSKLHLQFKKRYWKDLGCNGNTYADTGCQSTWEVTRAQGGKSGLLVDYTGGTIGASFGQGSATTRAKQFLQQIEPVLPGITKYWNGRAALDFWTGYPWTKGSYSYWKVGQYTKFAGMERQRQGNCHFAGEHTSIDFQGYLNGAVESAERVVSEILSDLK
jgi:monoamine oxidase